MKWVNKYITMLKWRRMRNWMRFIWKTSLFIVSNRKISACEMISSFPSHVLCSQCSHMFFFIYVQISLTNSTSSLESSSWQSKSNTNFRFHLIYPCMSFKSNIWDKKYLYKTTTEWLIIHFVYWNISFNIFKHFLTYIIVFLLTRLSFHSSKLLQLYYFFFSSIKLISHNPKDRLIFEFFSIILIYVGSTSTVIHFLLFRLRSDFNLK